VGWYFINLTAVWPVQADLELLSRAAWEEPTPPGKEPDPAGQPRPQPSDELLEKYPDLRAVSPAERGRVLAKKITADLMAGIPLGICFGALFVLAVAVPVYTTQVIAAGPLVRRQGPRFAVLLPYVEVSVPATVLFVLAFSSTVEHYFNIRLQLWHLALFVLLGLVLIGTRCGWPWPLRLLLHAGWLWSAGMVVLRWV
jgi:hypothetical protein